MPELIDQVMVELRSGSGAVRLISEFALQTRARTPGPDGVEEVLDGHHLAVRIDVDADAAGWVIAWVADLDTGVALWTLTPAPIDVTRLVGTVARIWFPDAVADGPADDPRLEWNLSMHTDERDQEIRRGRATLTMPAPAKAAQRQAWDARPARRRGG